MIASLLPFDKHFFHEGTCLQKEVTTALLLIYFVLLKHSSRLMRAYENLISEGWDSLGVGAGLGI